MKRIYLMALVAISIVISGCDNQAKQRELEEQRQEDSIRVAEDGNTEADETSILNFVGQYEFTDIKERTFVLVLNEDETCQLSEKGTDFIYYGSYCDFRNIDRGIGIWLEDEPEIIFPSSDKSDRVIGMCISPSADFIYLNDGALKAKHPKKRLELKKTK